LNDSVVAVGDVATPLDPLVLHHAFGDNLPSGPHGFGSSGRQRRTRDSFEILVVLLLGSEVKKVTHRWVALWSSKTSGKMNWFLRDKRLALADAGIIKQKARQLCSSRLSVSLGNVGVLPRSAPACTDQPPRRSASSPVPSSLRGGRR